jgi:hypothetical protein
MMLERSLQLLMIIHS